MAEAALFVLFVLLGVGGTILLYVLIDSETTGSKTMDRSDAEAYARGNSARRYGDERERE